jgi:hypothetical protein
MLNNDMNRLFADGGINQQGGTVDPVSGNEVPPGAMQKEVRDDIPAQLSEGEFVIPADVVRYIGLERLMKLRDEAKAGLARMNEIGQMGNADQVKNPEALHGDEFGQEIDDIMAEVDSEGGDKHFAAGGFAAPNTDYLAKYNIPKTSITNPALDVRAYKNAEGRVMYITFFNDKPSIQIPAGYEFAGTANEFLAEVKKTADAKKDTTVTATETIDGGGPGGDSGTTSGGADVGTSTGISGTSIGNSAIGVAIGTIANAIDSITNSITDTVAAPVAVTDAVASTVSNNNSNDSNDSDGIGATQGSGNNGGDEGAGEDSTGTVGAPSDSSASATSADGASSGDSSSGDGGDGGSLAKGGLVTSRLKTTTLAQKRGIASKK